MFAVSNSSFRFPCAHHTGHRAFAPLVLVAAALLALPSAGFGQAVTPVPNGTWVQTSPATSPSARWGATMVYDAANNTVVLFGGEDSSGTLGDTWTWDGTTWTQQALYGTVPPPRYQSTMAYDAATGTVVLFGGYVLVNGDSYSPGLYTGYYLADTWTWNGSTWTQQSPTTSPTARDGSTMAYDAANGTIVLFGGSGAGVGELSDTWTWDGTTWTSQAAGPFGPPARSDSTMAYDAANGTVVLFGGYDISNHTPLRDTWTWNGTTWTTQFPATSPSARAQSTTAYDAATDTVVLFGGVASSEAILSDTWTWNGTTWTLQHPATSPSYRYLATTAYDAATGTVVLFGGYGQSPYLGDTWNYQLSHSLGTVAVGSSTSAAVTFNVNTPGGALGTIVLTQGAPNLDFTLGTGSTCTGVTGACTVNVNFAPTVPGQRLGAVELTNSSGTILATALLSGVGSGPLATLTPGTISTVAGNGTAGYVASQDGGPATSAEIYNPFGIAVDGAGNLYIADAGNDRVRKVTAATGSIATFAGNGNYGYDPTQDGGPATSAELNLPYAVAVDGAGNVYIADQVNQRIRMVTAAGIITTIAGHGVQGYNAADDGGPATAAALNGPAGMAIDGAGNIYFADSGNNRIRKVTAATGNIATVAGNGTPGYVASQDGGAATSAELNGPVGVALDSAGNLYIADQANHRIREVTAATGIITTVAGNGTPGYVASQDGGAATSAELNGPFNVAVDGAGDLYIADSGNNRIRKVTGATGIITTVAGNASANYVASQDGGPATGANLYNPLGVAVDGAGNLYMADEYNYRIRKVSVKGGIRFPTATAAGSADSADGTQILTLNNIGNLPLTIASMQNDSSGNYVLANPLTGGCSTGVAVAAGGLCLLGEQFSPVAGSSGEVIGSLAITDNSLNAVSAAQYAPLLGTTTAGAIAVQVSANSVAAGAASDTIDVTFAYSGAATDDGAVNVTVNGSAAGVGTPTCVAKGGHMNCEYPYTGAALATPGNYPVAASVAANGSYSAGSATATLTVIGGPTYLPVVPTPVTRVSAPGVVR